MSRDILPEPPEELKRLSDSLLDRIREEMGDDGMIPFSRFMEMALYEPGLGYYSAGLHKFGQAGDFVTAPELGTLFPACLARQVAETVGRIGPCDVLEVGAGSGALAAGILNHLGPEELPRRYRILERSADLRAVQQETLARLAPVLAERVEWLDEPPTAAWNGILIANEVIDALSVERFELTTDGITQLCVAERDGSLAWTGRPAPEELRREVQRVLDSIPGGDGTEHGSGYRSEIQLQLAAWVAALTDKLDRGLALFIDYGYPRPAYYAAERRDGTLMCHYRHRAHDDVFFHPGLQDITAWVDFTALAEAADRCGLDVDGFCSQAMFLLGCGMEEILAEKMAASADGGLALGAETRQLTLPGMMGERFRVMGLGRGLDWPPRGFSLEDLRYQL
jgi:SAM-dependent MidA family methyltransferase